jgi:hypothetical protein
VIKLKKGIKTSIRRFLVIKTLLNGQKWDTQSLLKNINSTYFFRFQEQYSLETEEMNLEKLTDPMVSKILKDMRKDKIIKSEPMPQKSGRGPSGSQHWLVNDLEVYFEVLLEFLNFADWLEYREIQIDLHTYNRSIFLNSVYGQKFINMDLFEFFKSKIGIDINEKSKKWVLKILKISPSALKTFYVYVMSTEEYLELFQIIADDLTKENFMSQIVSAFIKDLTTPSFWTPYPVEFKSVFVIDEKGKNQKNPINRPKFIFNIEENSLSFDIISNGVTFSKNPPEDF